MHSAVRKAFPLFVLILAFPGLVPGPVFAERSELSEDEIKAGFIYNFSKYVRWPCDSDIGDLYLCVLGDNPFGDILGLIDGRSVRDHTIRVRRLKVFDSSQPCHILFMGLQASQRYPDVLAGVSRLPVLTIGEGLDFVRSGGVMSLFLKGNKVRFAVNVKAAEQAGLIISSKLLDLATVVYDRPAPTFRAGGDLPLLAGEDSP